MTFAQMNEGPKHDPHGTQTQVGWLGASGTFYPWPLIPTRDEEPGSYMPVYIDDEPVPDTGAEPDHPFESDPDAGPMARWRCRHCGRPRNEHEPVPDTGAEP